MAAAFGTADGGGDNPAMDTNQGPGPAGAPGAPSPRRRPRIVGPAALSPGPARYDPPDEATPVEKERIIREAFADHALRITIMHQTVQSLRNMVFEHEAKMSRIDQNDTEVKDKLASLETQLITNDVDLKSKLAKLESQVLTTAEVAKPEAMEEMQRLLSKIPELQSRVDESLKHFELLLVQVKADQTKAQ